MTLGLTQLGLIHTAVSLVAVVAGVVAFWRARAISLCTSAGKIYVVTTILRALLQFRCRDFSRPERRSDHERRDWLS
jgi:uncharacterized membrane protein